MFTCLKSVNNFQVIYLLIIVHSWLYNVVLLCNYMYNPLIRLHAFYIPNIIY